MDSVAPSSNKSCPQAPVQCAAVQGRGGRGQPDGHVRRRRCSARRCRAWRARPARWARCTTGRGQLCRCCPCCATSSTTSSTQLTSIRAQHYRQRQQLSCFCISCAYLDQDLLNAPHAKAPGSQDPWPLESPPRDRMSEYEAWRKGGQQHQCLSVHEHPLCQPQLKHPLQQTAEKPAAVRLSCLLQRVPLQAHSVQSMPTQGMMVLLLYVMKRL